MLMSGDNGISAQLGSIAALVGHFGLATASLRPTATMCRP
jgi:hypothetical protein